MVDGLLGQRLVDALGFRRRRFERAARTGKWSADGESISGAGSGMEATRSLREVLPGVLVELEVKRILDVPCGDWNWMRNVDLPVDHYFGGDLVESIVLRNRERFGRPGVEFGVFDLCIDELPAADLLLCRDVLIHFSFVDSLRVLDRLRESDIRYFASTTFVEQGSNKDQATSIPWRPINLQRPPYNLPEPSRLLIDDYNRPDQRLGIWRVEDL